MLINSRIINKSSILIGINLSKNKEFSSTSASRYSLALYELAEEANLLSQIEENSVAYLSLIDQSKEFNSFLKDPTLGQNILTDINNKISNKFKLENLFRNFLNFLILKRRYFYTEKILKSFIEICSEKRGELKAEIKSAKSLTQDEIKKITDELSNNFKSKIKLNYKQDEKLIGGLIVQVGSTMIDTSIKSKLQQIENRMIEV